MQPPALAGENAPAFFGFDFAFDFKLKDYINVLPGVCSFTRTSAPRFSLCEAKNIRQSNL